MDRLKTCCDALSTQDTAAAVPYLEGVLKRLKSGIPASPVAKEPALPHSDDDQVALVARSTDEQGSELLNFIGVFENKKMADAQVRAWRSDKRHPRRDVVNDYNLYILKTWTWIKLMESGTLR